MTINMNLLMRRNCHRITRNSTVSGWDVTVCLRPFERKIWADHKRYTTSVRAHMHSSMRATLAIEKKNYSGMIYSSTCVIQCQIHHFPNVG